MFTSDPNNNNTLGNRTDSERNDLDQNHNTPNKSEGTLTSNVIPILSDSFAIGELTEDDIFNHRRPHGNSVPVSPLGKRLLSYNNQHSLSL